MHNETYTEATDLRVSGSSRFFVFLRGFNLFQSFRNAFEDLDSIFFDVKLCWSTEVTRATSLSFHFEVVFRVCAGDDALRLLLRRKCDWNWKFVFLKFASISVDLPHIFRTHGNTRRTILFLAVNTFNETNDFYR